MKVILQSVDSLLNRLPYTLKELCSQFMVSTSPLEFDADINFTELENYGFNYCHIEEDIDTLSITTESGFLTIYFNDLNDLFESYTSSSISDLWIYDLIRFYGSEFSSAGEKIRRFYSDTELDRNLTCEDVANTLSKFLTLNKSNYDIICVECSKDILDVLVK